ncbi:beta-lactamase/transpeptidase-like protein [Xylariomycetidae sp. FL2044]|nr:beta-lactamase/transpeptidase-like protein [Xylariomycetidae sp. FL2044]
MDIPNHNHNPVPGPPHDYNNGFKRHFANATYEPRLCDLSIRPAPKRLPPSSPNPPHDGINGGEASVPAHDHPNYDVNGEQPSVAVSDLSGIEINGNFPNGMNNSAPNNIGGNVSYNFNTGVTNNIGGNISYNTNNGAPNNIGGNISYGMDNGVPNVIGGNILYNINNGVPNGIDNNIPNGIDNNIPNVNNASNLNGIYGANIINTDGLRYKMTGLRNKIKDILHYSGVPGVSIGVLHGGERFTGSCGFSHTEPLPNSTAFPRTTHRTVYPIGALTMSFTALAIDRLVQKRMLDWETRVCEILPEFRSRDEGCSRDTRVIDLLTHRTGLAPNDALWLQDKNELLTKPADMMKVVSSQDVVDPTRERFLFNAWNYDVLAKIIEARSGMSRAAFITANIIRPLDLSSTTTSAITTAPDEHRARGHMKAPEPSTEFTPLPPPKVGEGTVMQGALGIRSSAEDLLKYYNHVMNQSSFNHIASLPLSQTAIEEGGRKYSGGWVSARIPGYLGSIPSETPLGLPDIFSRVIVGQQTRERDVWYHNGGGLPGFSSSVYIVPETGTVIVVLLNGTPKTECASFVGQMILELLLDTPTRHMNNWVYLAHVGATYYDEEWKLMTGHVEITRNPHMLLGDLRSYEGHYFNVLETFYIHVFLTRSGELCFRFQGKASQQHQLKPRQPYVFSWCPSEEMARNAARLPCLDWRVYLFNFPTAHTGFVNMLEWKYNPDGPAHIFRKMVDVRGTRTKIRLLCQPRFMGWDEKGGAMV